MPSPRRLPLSRYLTALLAAVAISCSPEPKARYIDSDGTVRPLDVLDGQPRVLHYWASWCPPCREELPALQQYLDERRPQELELLVVATQEPLEKAQRFLRGRGFTIPTVGDPDGALFAWSRGRAVPTTILFAADGTELERIVGAAPWGDPAFRLKLDELARSGRPPAEMETER